MSRLRSSRYLLEAPMVIRMVLTVQEHLKLSYLIILKSFCFSQFAHKTHPGIGLALGFLLVLAQVLKEPVGGSHGAQDGPGCPKTPSNYQCDHT